MLKLMFASNIFGHGIGEKKLKKLLNIYPNILHIYEKNNEK
jgi:DNA ligase (NAD+)